MAVRESTCQYWNGTFLIVQPARIRYDSLKLLMASSRGTFGIFTALAFAGTAAYGQLSVAGFENSRLSVDANGGWKIALAQPEWNFSGRIESRPWNLAIDSGADALGSYQQISFDYAVGGAVRGAGIRLYENNPLATFSLTYRDAAANGNPFPAITGYPSLPHLNFYGMFAAPEFTHFSEDSPWAFFDRAGNTFIVSPGSDYLVANMRLGANDSILSGISPDITELPAGFRHTTALAWGSGINQTFDTWGKALTDLTGKHRPPNDIDALLDTVSYWTDNGATYYYNPGGSSYTGTLLGARAELAAKGIRLGSLQLDSWWYPKGPDNSWFSRGGIWNYSASPGIFQPDLKSFASDLGVPLVAHARWIDANSPLRSHYRMSGNVSTDPAYWNDIAAYLKHSGVATYEQDWLGDAAHSDFNLTDPYLFFDGMAAAMEKYGLTMQYCMAEPRHFLQSAQYGNLTTIRASQDGFGRARWTDFLYSSRLAGGLGIWPFTDVLMSTNRNDLLVATLSAGPVGIGDPLGKISGANLLRAVRPDGVIVKPDVPATPDDATILADAQGQEAPMVASTYTDLGGGVRATYIFAYARGTGTSFVLKPTVYGIAGDAWLYDESAGKGRLVAGYGSVTLDLTNAPAFYVLMPVGKAGIAFLGDKGHFVSLGRKRVSSFIDDTRLEVEIQFAAGEKARTLFGYSPKAVAVTSIAGSHSALAWDASTQMFSVVVHPGKTGRARVRMIQSFAPVGVARVAN